jgi:hypothetical protein
MAVVGGGGTKTSVCQLRGEGRIPGRGNSGGGGRRKTEAAWEMSRVAGGARHGSACLGSAALAS